MAEMPSYNPQHRNSYQHQVVQRWLTGVAYKPGSRFETGYDAIYGNITVRIRVLLFDSTVPGQVNIHRGKSLAGMAQRTPLQVEDGRPLRPTSSEVVHFGPDLVSGRLIEVRKSPEVPWHLHIPSGPDSPIREDLCKEEFLRWLRSELHALEAHEADEWFRDATSNQLFFDPHAGPPR